MCCILKNEHYVEQFFYDPWDAIRKNKDMKNETNYTYTRNNMHMFVAIHLFA